MPLPGERRPCAGPGAGAGGAGRRGEGARRVWPGDEEHLLLLCHAAIHPRSRPPLRPPLKVGKEHVVGGRKGVRWRRAVATAAGDGDSGGGLRCTDVHEERETGRA
jgi:hypothetical protein